MEKKKGNETLLDLSIEHLRGIGEKRGAVMRQAGIATLWDLFMKVPRRYVDRTKMVQIAELPIGESVTVIAEVVVSKSTRSKRNHKGRLPPTTIQVADESGALTCIWFRGGSYLKAEPGDLLALSGKVEVYRGQLQMTHPEYEYLSEGIEVNELVHTARIVPLYGTNSDMKESGLGSRGFRRMIWEALEKYLERVEEPYELNMRNRNGLCNIHKALQYIHFPKTFEELNEAKRRLAFDELFDLQMFLLRHQRNFVRGEIGNHIKKSNYMVPNLLKALPFSLTGAQVRVCGEIEGDMALAVPMRRLLHGEVGSGKTLVAIYAILTAIESGYQAALMAPTEILAEQHFRYIQSMLSAFGIFPILLTGGQSRAIRQEILTAVQSGTAQVIVGTHSLIEPQVKFARLGLVIVDEQHRFGVSQRTSLYDKEAKADILVMTATPIPRSLALTLYGDLEVSVLDEVPPGRKPVRTEIRKPDRRGKIFEFVASRIRKGEQAFVVYPAIEESQQVSLKSALEGFEELSSGPLAEFEIGILHGRLHSERKGDVMEKFVKGELHVLVATTVIEVGLDIPRATIMVIEHAERFGLAQLHQLRGRVGRGGDQGYCILVDYGKEVGGVVEGPSRSVRRLEAFSNTENGFEIAECDLELRGPGEVLGTKQAGLPPFVVADPLRDLELMQRAREEAKKMSGIASKFSVS